MTVFALVNRARQRQSVDGALELQRKLVGRPRSLSSISGPAHGPRGKLVRLGLLARLDVEDPRPRAHLWVDLAALVVARGSCVGEDVRVRRDPSDKEREAGGEGG